MGLTLDCVTLGSILEHLAVHWKQSPTKLKLEIKICSHLFLDYLRVFLNFGSLTII
jgi:hypothetical protein